MSWVELIYRFRERASIVERCNVCRGRTTSEELVVAKYDLSLYKDSRLKTSVWLVKNQLFFVPALTTSISIVQRTRISVIFSSWGQNSSEIIRTGVELISVIPPYVSREVIPSREISGPIFV